MIKQQAAKNKLTGLGRVLITVYLILAVGATGRSLYQLLRKFDEAPLAYSLSLLAAVVYILATVALIKRRGIWHLIAWLTLIFEFCGVMTVGALSVFAPQLFAHPSVWSHFGAGYVFVPLVLPLLGMLWLRGLSEDKARGGVNNA